jgi:hypothetical protein
VFDLGNANTGLSPVFTDFVNADTGVAVTPPAISEAPWGNGAYLFDFDWATTTATSIWWKVIEAGVELSDTINSTTIAAATGAGSTGAASQPWLDTAGNIINRVATEVGLREVADPYASQDPAIIRLRNLLRSAGAELILGKDWTTLVKEATYTGDGASTVFNLPPDFLRMKGDSGWRRADNTPFGGPISSQEWQALKAWTSTVELTVMFRLVGARIEFFTAPETGVVLYHDYVSRYWASTTGAAQADLLYPTASSDKVMLEPQLLVALLKAKWLEAIGDDSSVARSEFGAAYEGAASTEGARTLSLVGPRTKQRFIDGWNAPETGYGS